ncbi:hypothetical protein KIN20_017514 [Parelaphostrongylus tenuis]|uniref:Uncharacterized protein n=1 Tax=Parelaphostrongylus tenuis TaxID=148309 RepID=A0AAD5N0X8_PARTN|nr:hypothetical protein KIN20_017514 [Parelaphostrongylus tenuis]
MPPEGFVTTMEPITSDYRFRRNDSMDVFVIHFHFCLFHATNGLLIYSVALKMHLIMLNDR